MLQGMQIFLDKASLANSLVLQNHADGVATPNALKRDSNFSNAAIVTSTATVTVVENFIFLLRVLATCTDGFLLLLGCFPLQSIPLQFIEAFLRNEPKALRNWPLCCRVAIESKNL